MSRWAFDAEREARWEMDRRRCLIRECLDRPDVWRPIIKRWLLAGRPGTRELLDEIRAEQRRMASRSMHSNVPV